MGGQGQGGRGDGQQGDRDPGDGGDQGERNDGGNERKQDRADVVLTIPAPATLDDGIEPEDADDVREPPGSPFQRRQLPLALGGGPDAEIGVREFSAESAAPDEVPMDTWGFGTDGGDPFAPGSADGPAVPPTTTDGQGPGEVDFPIVTIDYEAPPTETRQALAVAADTAASATIIAIASGRGGAGKSLLAANMAVYLAQIGKRVVAVDADPAGGTLNHLLGTPRPGRGFGSFLRGRAETLDELAVDTPVAGVRLIAGETLPFGSPRSKSTAKAVLAALGAISADTIVVDLGPPDSAFCLDLWLGAHTSILVTLADPASIEAATDRFVKSAFLRGLRGERGLDKLQGQVGRPLPAALDLYRVALEVGRSAREDDTHNPLASGEANAGPRPSPSSSSSSSWAGGNGAPRSGSRFRRSPAR